MRQGIEEHPRRTVAARLFPAITNQRIPHDGIIGGKLGDIGGQSIEGRIGRGKRAAYLASMKAW